MKNSFFNPYSQGFFRCAAATPLVALANPSHNASSQIVIAQQCHKKSVGVVVFPELSLSGYSIQDLLQQQCLLEECEKALITLLHASVELTPLIITGLPLLIDGRLFNCAAVIQGGRLLGIVPKSMLPNHREFYEKRHFSSADELLRDSVQIAGQTVALGTNLLFRCREHPNAVIGIEICEDLWAPIAPATFAAMAGATLICNLSASNIVIGKADYRRLLIKATSGRNICGYIYSGAGHGESTTDMAWDGHAVIAENGSIISESERFAGNGSFTVNDIDVDKLILERMRVNSFKDCGASYKEQLKNFRSIEFSIGSPAADLPILRRISRFPFVPEVFSERDERCYEAFNIQTEGLTSRIQASGIERLIVGVSGGLDSTLALLVSCRALDKLGISRQNLVACTMPAFATSEATRKNAWELMQSLGVSCREIDIKPSCMQMLKDLDHPFARGEKVYDITFENVQAGERTSHLFRLANSCNGMVVGTGDLSELALGWCTYGVGDHMSHYNVNASIPKTLVKFLISWAAENTGTSPKTAEILGKILNTAISPELVPGEGSSQPAQETEKFTGPYELQDFNLYYLTRFGFRPSKVAYLSWCAWGNGDKSYSFPVICSWLEKFIRKFFGQSQFKRSCVPDSPKVGSGGALSPRSDWRAPSDASATIWLEELKNNTPRNN